MTCYVSAKVSIFLSEQKDYGLGLRYTFSDNTFKYTFKYTCKLRYYTFSGQLYLQALLQFATGLLIKCVREVLELTVTIG